MSRHCLSDNFINKWCNFQPQSSSLYSLSCTNDRWEWCHCCTARNQSGRCWDRCLRTSNTQMSMLHTGIVMYIMHNWPSCISNKSCWSCQHNTRSDKQTHMSMPFQLNWRTKSDCPCILDILQPDNFHNWSLNSRKSSRCRLLGDSSSSTLMDRSRGILCWIATEERDSWCSWRLRRRIGDSCCCIAGRLMLIVRGSTHSCIHCRRSYCPGRMAHCTADIVSRYMTCSSIRMACTPLINCSTQQDTPIHNCLGTAQSQHYTLNMWYHWDRYYNPSHRADSTCFGRCRTLQQDRPLCTCYLEVDMRWYNQCRWVVEQMRGSSWDRSVGDCCSWCRLTRMRSKCRLLIECSVKCRWGRTLLWRLRLLKCNRDCNLCRIMIPNYSLDSCQLNKSCIYCWRHPWNIHPDNQSHTNFHTSNTRQMIHSYNFCTLQRMVQSKSNRQCYN